MPTIPSYSALIDDEFVTTFFEVRPEARDNVITANVISALLQAKSVMQAQEGGTNIERGLKYAIGPTPEDISQGSVLPIGVTPTETAAFWRFERYTAAHAQRNTLKDASNAGKFQIKSYVTKRMKEMLTALKQKYEAAFLHAHVTDETGQAPQMLCDMVPPPATRTTGTYGNVARPTGYTLDTTPYLTDTPTGPNAWMSPKYMRFSGDPNITLLADLRSFFNIVTAQQEAPDIVLLSQILYEMFEDFGLEAIQVFQNEKMLDLGFKVLKWNGAELTWAPGMAAGATLTDGTSSGYSGLTHTCLMLNSAHMELIYNPLMYYYLTEWQTIPRSLEKLIYTICQETMVSDELRRHGLLYAA